MKISTSKVLLIGILYAIIAQVVNTVSSFLSMSYYLMPAYFPVWSKIMMPTQGPPPASFFAFGIAFAFITGCLIALVYSAISVPGKTKTQKGLWFGIIIFLIAGIPGAFANYLLINIPAGLIWIWAIENLIIYLLAGLMIAKLVK